MKILFLALAVYGREGGMERFNRRVVRCLSEYERRGDVEAATVLGLWETEQDAHQSPDNLHLIPAKSSKPGMVLALAAELRRTPPTVVLYGHVLLLPLALVVRLLSPRSTQILFVHGDEVWDPPLAAHRWAVHRLIEKIVSVSAFTQRCMQKTYGLAARKFALLPNAVDTSAESASAVPPPAPVQGRERILTVSRLTWRDRNKGIDKLIQALPQVLQQCPDAHLFVVGDGDDRGRLEALAASLGVAPHVHFLGWVPDADRDAVYRSSDLFVMPSTQEGFGIVYLEAWLYELPVISSNRDAASEVITDGVNGLCVDPEPTAIGAAILRLLSDPQQSTAMGAAGRQTVLQRYSHSQFEARLWQILAPWQHGRRSPKHD